MNRHQRRAEKHLVRGTEAVALAVAGYLQKAAQLCQEGRLEDAAGIYRRALVLDPHSAETHYSLANALRDHGQPAAAIELYRHAIELKPDFAEAENNLGVALQQAGRVPEAVDAYRRAISRRPDFAEAHDNLGLALSEQGLLDAAIICHRQAIELMPNVAEPYNHLGVALRRIGAGDEAIACYRQAIQLKPDLAAAHNNLGVALHDQGHSEIEMICYRAAIRYQPGFADAHANLGVALQERGELDASFASFERAVALAPRRGAFHRMLAETGRIADGDPAMRRLDALATTPAALPVDDQIEVHFALGLLHAAFGRTERSLPHLMEGNRLKRARIKYDEAATLGSFDLIKEAFTRETLAAAHGTGAATRAPIFVVGMPRSGTTLVEQILASHPLIHGAGELPDLQALVVSGKPELAAMTLQDWRETTRRENIASIGADYVARLTSRAPSASRIVDKMPDNFLLVALIHMALPGARIIHVVRDPLDTCMSCFSRLFNTGVSYSYDLAELGRYHLAYRDLMSHWQQALPPGALLAVRYEDLVSDLEGQVRRLLDYCEVPWSESCLAFHESTRPVRTASATQVRQPLYRSSIGRWQAVADRVVPLLDPLSQWAAA